MLKKEFKKSDVQRLRNLMTGNSNERTVSGVGYEKQQEEYNEGDEWIDAEGRKWTIKNGIKQNITKFDEAKKTVTLPLFCPCCNQIMKHKNDKLFYIQYNRCFNCQIDFETELKIKGLWEEWQKTIHNSDIDHMIKEYSIWSDEIAEDENKSYITEDGDIERWIGSTKQKILQNKEETIKYLESLKK